MKKLLFTLILIPISLFSQEESSINFLNTERSNHSNTDGLIYYDVNFYPDYNAVTGSDGGGLSIYSVEDGWGAVIATNNMQWITPTFNGGIFNGNVGIGTTTPEYKLHVSSGTKLRKTTIGSTIASYENSWLRDDWLTGNYGPPTWDQNIQRWVRPSGAYNDVGGIIYQDEGTYFIRDNKGEQLEYTNVELLNKSFLFAHIGSGNIGIGTTTPDSKLSVNGKIHTKEVLVDLIGWSDFVFENSYNLPSLEEVEQHIKEKGHLKDIPSAQEVEESGILLGEINAKLLQKIEELTLYTIEQEKKLKEQREKNIEQEEKNIELEERLEKLENLLIQK